MDLRLQVEELRRRLDSGPQRVQVIDLADRQPVADLVGESNGEEPGAVLYRSGMTMAEVEKSGHRGGAGGVPGQPPEGG